jgi:hypothetical protein
MKEPIRSRPLRIGDARTAAAFAHPLRRRLLLFLAAREASLTQIARLTRVDLRRVHHHVTALCALGLIVVVQERPRAGRAIKIYRAVAPAFFVPQNLTAAEPAAPLAVEMEKSLGRMRAMTRSGVIYEVSETGTARMRPVSRPGPGAVPTAEIWQVLRLSRSDAEHLAGDLASCLRRYAQKDSERGEPYVVHCALAPRRTSVRRVART